MKGGIAAHVIANKINSARVRRNEFRVRNAYGNLVTMQGQGKKGKDKPFDENYLAQLCREIGVDPARTALLGLRETSGLTEKERIDLSARLMEYLHPKKRAVDGNIDVEASLTIELVKDFGDPDKTAE